MRMCDFRKLIVVALLVVAMTLVIQAAAPKDAAVVKDVALSSVGRSLEARITTSESARFSYFELENPHRLVVDFHGLKNGIGFTQKDVAAAGVARVRTSYFTAPDRSATRIVFDLDGSVNYRVLDEGSGLVRILFGDSVRPKVEIAGKAPSNLVAGPPMLAKGETTPVFSKGKLTSLSQEVVPAPVQEPVVLPSPVILQATPTPATVTTPEPAGTQQPDPGPTPAPVLPAAPQGPPQVPVTPQAPSGTQTPAPGTRLSPQISTSPEPTAPILTGPAEPQNFNGEVIDLDLKQAELSDFFRLIGDISGLNVVVDQNVTGSVTILLKDVPWDQALDIVLRNYNLGGVLQGNVLRVATKGTLQNEDTQRRAAQAAVLNSVNPISRTYVLNYTKAQEVAATLNASGVLSTRGKVATELRRNAIIVTDVPDQFDAIEKMKNFIDVPSQQVEIEARLLSANKSFSRELGSQLALLVGANTGNILTGGQGDASPFNRVPAPRVTVGGSGLPLLTNLPAAATSGVAFLLQPGGNILLDAIITAAEAHGTARLLSQPKVTTENNKQAVISQGTKIPVQTNVNNTITTTFLNFSLQLQVTPQITEDGTILMDINIENSSPDFARTVNGVPSVASQEARTQAWVPDGSTMMIGGIFIDTDSLNIRQVPGLGSIPLIGHLFKNQQTIKSQAELFFFITPRIRKADALASLAPRN
jgi:type IV pilus secretin PilQ/predicted competence protein